MDSTSGRGAVGLLLAAGAGTRAGRPKALVRGADGTPWVVRATSALLTGGCDAIVVVLGARADEARVLVPDDPRIGVVVADDWAEGLGASLRTGLRALSTPSRPDAAEEARCALVSLVDLPGLPPAAVARLLDVDDAARTGSLRQAAFGGRPGHPVLVGREHWEPLAAGLAGDSGARTYLDAHGADRVDCSDLWDGADVDRPA